MIFGRVTYDGFAEAWPRTRGGRREDAVFAKILGDARKVVASGGPWTCRGATPSSCKAISSRPCGRSRPNRGGNIGMSGSVSIVRQLLEAGLLDDLHLFVHPIAVRHGLRLFDEAATTLPLHAALVGDVPERRAAPGVRTGRRRARGRLRGGQAAPATRAVTELLDLSVEHRQVERGQPIEVVERVDGDDAAVGDGEGHHRHRPPVRCDDDAGGAVDQRRARRRQRPRTNMIRRCSATARAPRTIARRAARPGVGAQHDVGVEHARRARRSRRARAAAKKASTTSRWRARSGSGVVRRALHPAPGPAGQLAGGGRRAVDDRWRSRRTARRTCRAARTPAARRAAASRARPAAPGRPSRRAAPRARGRRRRAGRRRVGHVRLQRLLGAGAARAQHVEADPGDDRRQPAAEVLDLVGVGAAAAAATPPARRRRPR